MILSSEQVQRLADYLCGTCHYLDDALDALDFGLTESALDDQTYQELDNIVFCCTGCNWWFEISDLNEQTDSGDWVCGTCFEEPDEQEEE